MCGGGGDGGVPVLWWISPRLRTFGLLSEGGLTSMVESPFISSMSMAMWWKEMGHHDDAEEEE